MRATWRRGRESNPQGCYAHTVFKTGTVATSDCLSGFSMAEGKGVEPSHPEAPALAMRFRYPAVFRITPPSCAKTRTRVVSSSIDQSF